MKKLTIKKVEKMSKKANRLLKKFRKNYNSEDGQKFFQYINAMKMKFTFRKLKEEK